MILIWQERVIFTGEQLAELSLCTHTHLHTLPETHQEHVTGEQLAVTLWECSWDLLMAYISVPLVTMATMEWVELIWMSSSSSSAVLLLLTPTSVLTTAPHVHWMTTGHTNSPKRVLRIHHSGRHVEGNSNNSAQSRFFYLWIIVNKCPITVEQRDWPIYSGVKVRAKTSRAKWKAVTVKVSLETKPHLASSACDAEICMYIRDCLCK